MGFVRVGVCLALYDVDARLLHKHLLIDVATRAVYVHAEELTHVAQVVVPLGEVLVFGVREVEFV